MPPHVLLCGSLSWAQEECQELFRGVAEVLHLDSPSRDEFFADCKPGGKYDAVVGIYRNNLSRGYIGVFDKELIAHLPSSLKWIAHQGAGYDNIDAQACKARGITISNTPGAVDDATATTALYLMISALRHFAQAERDLRAGNWKYAHNAGSAHDLTGRTLAILGLGGIGLRFAELAHAFPMRVVYHSRNRNPEAPEWCQYFDAERLDEMLTQADVLSVHVPLRPDTVGFVDERMIRKLKKGAVIVNTARGKVIDEDAMIRALEDGHLGGVGLDVYPNEPNINPRLLEFKNATLLPHMGASTGDTMKKMEVRALTNLRDFVMCGTCADIVPECR
ncbi:hypothetical protein L226DRAFT_576697 [Lentinus tigrinus ALCF2SS1-7]|uniref:Glyoxylate reductase n=1 Tax=Lentinus tigrinus ALCF2SS1-6 TaxID=1328759 RepID=A0A5C2RM99_9APHY|nr:hypothetical protein L227DRAFT_617547 [Lentinus tigrinus ALCF2SS1-6]RPD68084.1 hypothetical protein L226DRAFT_576697 [Lentinus tigrinus ALCF2SS1-7]